MFTGIVQSVAIITAIKDQEGLRTITLDFEEAFCADLVVGGSVSVDGVCLTVTRRHNAHCADFDVMLQSLRITTLHDVSSGFKVNVERAAKKGAEVGGHPLSGHVDLCGKIIEIHQPPNNHLLRIQVPPSWMRYIFSKGYIALNGASLTVSEANRQEGWFEVWLIPETLRRTTFLNKKINDLVNIEIERNTQIMVDTLRSAIEEQFVLMRPTFAKELMKMGSGFDS
ncbi:MAG: riboflavin synthase subunit alpha [Chthoniobacterales bacterium]|nr:riboflavin synthase subunit alpha [Chthoniobacterales bacterium]